ncbi:MAG: serine/threonine protein kinase [Planctomycetaceae bacterium]|jgi:serine/threonine protein kinase
MPEEQWDSVAAHIETCAACEDTISSLDGTADSMLDHLRTPPSHSIAGTPEYLAAMAKLQNQLNQGAPTSSRGESELPDHVDADSPEVVRDYKLISILGAGGMGTVYKAIHTKLDRVVALKLLPTRRIGNADAIVRFEREMKAIGKLDHPAIVRATDAGEDDGQHFLAMEFVDGFDVSELVERHGPLSVPDASEIIRQAAIGLQHVHERQLVHRDIKPSNLMVTEDGQVKILDLGLALLADQHEGLGELTTVGQMMGTVDYMAPEQCNDSHDVDIRADIYSLGATLFKMLTGTAPYATSENRSPLSRIRALATEDPPRLADCLPNADYEFCSVVDRMLSRTPEDRFETPGDVAKALQPFTAGHDLKQAVAVAADAPAPAARIPLHHPRLSQPARSEVAATTDNNSKPPSRILTVAKYLIPIILLATAAFIFRLETDKGELVVECHVPNVEVLLLRDGSVHEELSLKQGTTSVSVRSGKYEIKIPGKADSVEISADRFTISRGSKLVAHIRYAAAAEQAGATERVVGEVPMTTEQEVESTYSGKTFAQWRTQLADRDPSQLEPALDAIGVLGVDANADEAGRLIFDAVKSLFRHSSKLAPHTFPTPSGTADDVMRYRAVQAYRPLLDDQNGVNLLREFLTEGDTAARRYALCVLDCREVKPSSAAPGYAAAQRALRGLVPALVAASFDEDVTVRTRAISQTQSFERNHPEIIDRYVELISSDDFAVVYDLSGILFDLSPEHRKLIGERHLKFYVDNLEAFRTRRSQGERNALVGDYYSGAMDLLFAAIESGVKSDQITDALFEYLNDPQANVNDRAQAAYLLANHSAKAAQLVPMLIDLLQDDTPLLDKKCSIEGHRFNDDFGPPTLHYLNFRAAIFDILRQIGSAAKDAIPEINSFLNPNPASKNRILKVSLNDHEALATGLQALSSIGLTAESIPALERFRDWPVTRAAKPDLALLAAQILHSIPVDQLERLRGESPDKAPPRQ